MQWSSIWGPECSLSLVPATSPKQEAAESLRKTLSSPKYSGVWWGARLPTAYMYWLNREGIKYCPWQRSV